MRSFPAWAFLVVGLIIGALAGALFARSSPGIRAAPTGAGPSPVSSSWNSLPFHLKQDRCAGTDCAGPNWVPEDLEEPGKLTSKAFPFYVLSNMSVNGGGGEIPETVPDESSQLTIALRKAAQTPPATEHYAITIPEASPLPGASPRQQTLFLNGVRSGKAGEPKRYVLVTCDVDPSATPAPCPYITPTPTPTATPTPIPTPTPHT